MRPPNEEALFKQALSSLAAFYAHRAVIVFRLTRFPAGYPEEYSAALLPGTKVNEYANRGWVRAQESRVRRLTRPDCAVTLTIVC